MEIHLRYLLVFILISITSTFGCSSDSGIDDPQPELDPPLKLPFAETEDQLMDNFRTALEEMSIEAYSKMLHVDFATFLQNSTQLTYPSLGPTIDRAEEVRIALRMLSGQPVADPDNLYVPGIAALRFSIFKQQSAWTDAMPNDLIPDSRIAMFDVTIMADRTNATSLKVEGQIKFYVTVRDTLHQGVVRDYWEMRGQQDLTNAGLKAIQPSAWGSFKVMFR